MTPRLHLTPDARLVHRTADATLGDAEVAALLAEVRDWPRLLYLAGREVAQLALWRAVEKDPRPMPRVEHAALLQGAMQLDLRMQQLARRTQQSTAALAAAGVRCLLLKGAAIGAVSDASFRARPMTDVDVLVQQADVERAQAALLGARWNLTTNPVYREMLKDAHHLPHFVDDALPGLRLELHVSLMPDDHPFGFDEGLLWRDAHPAPPPFDGALVPSAEHLLLHACVHFAWQHTLAFGAWRTFRTVSSVTARPEFNWDRFTDQTLAVKAGTCGYWTLRLAQSIAGISVPTSTLERLAPPTARRVLDALERHFIAQIVPGEGPASPSIKLTRLLWRTALRPEWSGHAHPGRDDPEQRWAKAYGTASEETRLQRYTRHLKSVGQWSRFVRETLLR